jgi:HEPN domain-containing protein
MLHLCSTTEFLAGAELFRIRKQNKMAAFMLHQAAEHGMLAIIQIKG